MVPEGNSFPFCVIWSRMQHCQLLELFSEIEMSASIVYTLEFKVTVTQMVKTAPASGKGHVCDAYDTVITQVNICLVF